MPVKASPALGGGGVLSSCAREGWPLGTERETRARAGVVRFLRQLELALFATFHIRLGRRWLDKAMRLVTELAGPIPSVGLCALYLFHPRLHHPWGWRMVAAVGGSHLVVQLLKHVVQRDRPYLVVEGSRGVVAPLLDHSFPSGHTTSAASMAVVLSGAAPALAPALIALAALVAFSRMYLGHHYPSDVLAGALIGALSGVSALALIG
ncbi:MAG TPA: phosphatase PAP2 family protein [Limnochorda sp.]